MLKTLSSMGQRRQNIFQDGRFLLFCEAPKKIQSSQKLSLIFFECVQNSKWHQTAKNSLEMLRMREILFLTFFPSALTPNYFRTICRFSEKVFFSGSFFQKSDSNPGQLGALLLDTSCLVSGLSASRWQCL